VTGTGNFLLASIYRSIVYIAMMPSPIIPTFPPMKPTSLKTAGVARTPIPTNNFSMLKAVWKVPTLPVIVPSLYEADLAVFNLVALFPSSGS